ncbi:MAG: hypothetical protein LBK02_00055 [Treponema sp.]|jgi:hypothetical protein|nr:hypothetical protein [Treponema sp.]
MKHFFVLRISVLLLVCSACTRPDPEPRKNFTPFPDLEIGMKIPSGMEAASPAQLRELRDLAAEFPPILPFADFPCYQFLDPGSGATMIISRMNQVNPDRDQDDPAKLMYEYRENLARYYRVDSVTAHEAVQGEFRFLAMNLLYEPGDKSLYIIKVLYHRYPRQYFMIELFLDTETVNPEMLKIYEEMFQSIQPMENTRRL